MAKRKSEINRREKVVLASGAFDLLHLGHVKYLEEAKKAVELLGSLKAPRAKVLLTAPFGKTSLNPMHFNRNEELDKLARKFLSEDILYTSDDVSYTKILGKIMTKAA